MSYSSTAVRSVSENVVKWPSSVNGSSVRGVDGVVSASSGRAPGPMDKADARKFPQLTLRIKMGCKDKDVSKESLGSFKQNEYGLGPLSSQPAGEDHGISLSPEADRSPMSMIRVSWYDQMSKHCAYGGCWMVINSQFVVYACDAGDDISPNSFRRSSFPPESNLGSRVHQGPVDWSISEHNTPACQQNISCC